MKLTYKLAAIAVFTIAAAFAAIGSGTASAAGTTIHCQSPMQVSCDISNPDGIQQVIITGDTNFGEIEWVNKTYVSCPEEVTVVLGGDEVLSAGPLHFQVIPCDPMGLAPAPKDDGGKVHLAGAADSLSAGGQTTVQFSPHTACYANYTLCSLKAYECEHLGQGCPPHRP